MVSRLALIAMLLLPTVVVCQDSQPLTNAVVIEMVRSGIPASVIITKIRNSTSAFETDIKGLKSLTEAGVPEAVVSAMIEARGPAPQPKSAPTRPAAIRPFIPYTQLDKSVRRLRLKSPPSVAIVAAAELVSTVLVHDLQSLGFVVESESKRTVYMTREVRSTAAGILAGLVGNDKVQHEMRATISELEGVSELTLNLWITMENRYGKKTSENRNGKEKDRIAIEEILGRVKRIAEGRTLEP